MMRRLRQDTDETKEADQGMAPWEFHEGQGEVLGFSFRLGG
jgi:hypothetical protein